MILSLNLDSDVDVKFKMNMNFGQLFKQGKLMESHTDVLYCRCSMKPFITGITLESRYNSPFSPEFPRWQFHPKCKFRTVCSKGYFTCVVLQTFQMAILSHHYTILNSHSLIQELQLIG